MAEIISKLKIQARRAKKSAKKYADITKLKINIKVEEATLEEHLCELGRAYYQKIKFGKENDEEIATIIEAADNSSEKIAEYKKLLAKKENKEICQHCNQVKKTDEPCKKCGEKIVVEKPIEEEPIEEEPTDFDDVPIFCDDSCDTDTTEAAE